MTLTAIQAFEIDAQIRLNIKMCRATFDGHQENYEFTVEVVQDTCKKYVVFLKIGNFDFNFNSYISAMFFVRVIIPSSWLLAKQKRDSHMKDIIYGFLKSALNPFDNVSPDLERFLQTAVQQSGYEDPADYLASLEINNFAQSLSSEFAKLVSDGKKYSKAMDDILDEKEISTNKIGIICKRITELINSEKEVLEGFISTLSRISDELLELLSLLEQNVTEVLKEHKSSIVGQKKTAEYRHHELDKHIYDAGGKLTF